MWAKCSLSNRSNLQINYNKFMDEKKEYCDDLIYRWRELKSKFPKIQTIAPGESFTSSHITPEEFEEYREIMKKLKQECRDFLTPAEKFEIDERTA